MDIWDEQIAILVKVDLYLDEKVKKQADYT